MTAILLLAASGLAREVIAADQREHEIVGVLDDDVDLHGSSLDGVPVLGGIDAAADRPEALLICVGSGVGRQRIARRLAGLGVNRERYATVLDASVRVPSGCTVGAGSVLLAGCVLTANVAVGDHVVAMPRVTMTHDVVIEDCATLAAGVCLGGRVIVGAAAYLGMNCSVRQDVWVGAGAIVGMGAAVLGDVPAGQVWVGVPARRLAPVGAGGDR